MQLDIEARATGMNPLVNTVNMTTTIVTLLPKDNDRMPPEAQRRCWWCEAGSDGESAAPSLDATIAFTGCIMTSVSCIELLKIFYRIARARYQIDAITRYFLAQRTFYTSPLIDVNRKSKIKVERKVERWRTMWDYPEMGYRRIKKLFY
jgi:hypothetical protein